MYVCVRIISHRTLVTSYIVHNKLSFINTSELENPETKKCSFEMWRCALETLHASCVAPGPPVIWLEWLYRHTESQAVAQCVWGMCGLAWVVLVELVSLKKDKERTRCWNTQKVHLSYLESYFQRLKTTFTPKQCLRNGGSQTRSEALKKWIQRWRRFAVYGIVSSSTGDHQEFYRINKERRRWCTVCGWSYDHTIWMGGGGVHAWVIVWVVRRSKERMRGQRGGCVSVHEEEERRNGKKVKKKDIHTLKQEIHAELCPSYNHRKVV